jgi:hypothetical protein
MRSAVERAMWCFLPLAAPPLVPSTKQVGLGLYCKR